MPANRKARSHFLRIKKVLPVQRKIESVVSSPDDLKALLEDIAQGLESRFTALLSYQAQSPYRAEDFQEVTPAELANVVRTLPHSAPGSDGMTTSVIKSVHKKMAAYPLSE